MEDGLQSQLPGQPHDGSALSGPQGPYRVAKELLDLMEDAKWQLVTQMEVISRGITSAHESDSPTVAADLDAAYRALQESGIEFVKGFLDIVPDGCRLPQHVLGWLHEE